MFNLRPLCWSQPTNCHAQTSDGSPTASEDLSTAVTLLCYSFQPRLDPRYAWTTLCREQLVSGLREAFQQLSPGSKAPLGSATRSSGYTGGYLSPNQRSPVVQSRRDLKDQATRVLFKATQGRLHGRPQVCQLTAT
jgi:hypothetical protein